MTRGDGWFKADIGLVQVVYMDVIDEADHARFLAALRSDLEHTPPTSRRGVLYEVTDRNRSTAAERKAVGELLNEKRELLARITSGYALVTPSVMVRGFLTAVFWVAPPPYPHHIGNSLTDGLRFLANKQPGIDVLAVQHCYLTLRRELATR